MTVLDNDAFVGVVHLSTKNIKHRCIQVQLSRSRYIFHSGACTTLDYSKCLAGRDDGGVVGPWQREDVHTVVACADEVACIVEVHLTEDRYAVLVLVAECEDGFVAFPSDVEDIELTAAALQYKHTLVCRYRIAATIGACDNLLVLITCGRELCIAIEIVELQ